MAFANALDLEDEKVRKPGSESAEVLNANQQEEFKAQKEKRRTDEKRRVAGPTERRSRMT